MTLKQSVSWWCYERFQIEPITLMRHFVEIGYRGVELLPPNHFKLAQDFGLEIVAINGQSSLEVGLNKRENLLSIEKVLRQQLALAQQWRIPNLIVFSGNRDGQADADGLAITVENLQKLVPLAESAGVTLLLELLNSKVDHADFMCDRTSWGTAVCQQINSPNLKLLYDIYHMQVMEGDVIQTIRDNHQYIGHYHTAGVPGRGEIDETQELNYPAIMRAIQGTGYTGFVGQEFVPQGDPIAALRQAYTACEGG